MFGCLRGCLCVMTGVVCVVQTCYSPDDERQTCTNLTITQNRKKRRDPKKGGGGDKRSERGRNREIERERLMSDVFVSKKSVKIPAFLFVNTRLDQMRVAVSQQQGVT